MKRIVAVLLAIILVLPLTTCQMRKSDTAEPTPTPTATPSPTPTPTPAPTATPEPTPEPEPEFRDFFNGEGLSEQDYSRPFAVMLNNMPVAMPQCGISQADIIFEVLAEGITRMMGIFQHIEDVEKLGSMRSIRPYFEDISLSFGAVTVHAGGSEEAYSRIKSMGIENIDGVRGYYDPNPYYRDPNRMTGGIEHSLFAEGDKLYKAAEKLGYGLTLDEDYDNGFHFAKSGVPEKGESALSIKANFGYKPTDFTYDEEAGVYTVYQNKRDYIDGSTNEAVGFTNVIAFFADTKQIDSYGRLRVDLVAEGEGYFACGGKYVPITWSRDSETGPFHFKNADGSDLILGEGRTYVLILPTGTGSVEFE